VIAISVVVLLAHLAVLRTAPMALGLHTAAAPPTPPRPFTTRTVELVPARPTAAAPPIAPALAPLKRQSTPRAQTETFKPEPASIHASGAVAADPQPPASEVADGQSPDQASARPAAQDQTEAPAEADPVALTPRPPRETAPLVSAYTLPGAVRLKYTVTANKFPFSLNSELLWQQNGDSYEARLEYSAFGQSRVQTSRGDITPQGLAPLRFSDKFRSEVAAHFNREKGKVTFSANTPDVPLLAGAQDRLSILVQLAAMFAGAPDHFPEATTLTIQTIGPRDADTWLFTVGREETLTLPGGELATVKLLRNPRQAYDQRVELWLAPALGYLPARIRITESNGDFVDQKWLATEPQI
jgi:hypothetical protein